MSDYLGNLITRTLSHQSVVRPRLRSVFEPAPSDHLAGLRLEQEDSADRSLPAAKSYSTAAAAPMNRSMRVGFAPTELSLEQTPGDTDLSRAGDPGSSAAITASNPVTHSLKAEGTKPVKSLREEEPNRSKNRKLSQDDFAQNASRTRIRREPVSSQPEGNTDAGITGSPNESAVQSQAAAHPGGNGMTSLVPALTKSAQEEVVTPNQPAVKARNVRAIEAVVPVRYGASQSLSTFSQPAEPAINVTIGRVEIRATSAPPASQRSAPKSGKVLSLESYLRQRAKGDRR